MCLDSTTVNLFGGPSKAVVERVLAKSVYSFQVIATIKKLDFIKLNGKKLNNYSHSFFPISGCSDFSIIYFTSGNLILYAFIAVIPSFFTNR